MLHQSQKHDKANLDETPGKIFSPFGENSDGWQAKVKYACNQSHPQNKYYANGMNPRYQIF